MTNPTDLLTLPEAAEALGLSASTLRTQVQREKLHATKHGRDWLVTGAEIERYRARSRGTRQAGGQPR
jgi:excisionase family DNA binding protein